MPDKKRQKKKNTIDGTLENLHHALAKLQEIQSVHQSNWISSADISKALLTQNKRSLHWRTIDKLFHENRQYAERRKKKQAWYYRLLVNGEAFLSHPSKTIMLIQPSTALQSTIDFHVLLSSLIPPIRICDPYFEEKSIEHIQACPQGGILLLTYNIKDTGPLRRLLSAASINGYELEIRKTTSPILHDRYIIDKQKIFLLGTSLNGFGNKNSFIVEIGTDFRVPILNQFDSLWNSSLQWP